MAPLSFAYCINRFSHDVAHLLNHEKMCIKSEVEEILFKLATNQNQNQKYLLVTRQNDNHSPGMTIVVRPSC